MKFALDALWASADDSFAPRPPALVDDDQVRFLHASLWRSNGPPGTYLSVKPLRDVGEDYRLASGLASGRIDWRADADELFPDVDHPDPVETAELDAFPPDLRSWLTDFHKYTQQQALLDESDSLLMSQLSLAPFRIFGVAPCPRARRDGADENWADRAWSDLVDGIALTLPALPASHMSRAVFKQELAKGLARLTETRPTLYPLIAPARITIMLVPPAENSKNDLDNVARQVVPILRRELLVNVGSPSSLSFASRLLNNFQVIRLGRRRSDPPEGILRVLVGSGSRLESDWDRVSRFLERKLEL